VPTPKRGYSRPTYCAVVRAECPYPVEVGEQGVTLAYPFVDYRKDWATRTRETLRPLKIGAFAPHETQGSNYLICHVCREIRARPFHLSEVSQPNWNVWFEAGLAFGFGKTMVLADSANENVDRARQVFPHQLRLSYRYVEELTDQFLQVDPAKSLNISSVVASPNPRTVYFLDPGVENDYTRAMRKFLRRLKKFRYAAPEGGVLRSPTMHSLVYDIKSSGAIVGLLIPGTYKDFDIVNARSCFLLGVAVALEKPVLVLRQEPVVAGPADLGMVVQSCGSVPTMTACVTEWLQASQEPPKARASVPSKRTTILEIDLGNAWAERDAWLENYFVETGEYRRASESRTTVFLGRKWAGKSALAIRLTDPRTQGRGIALRLVQPEEFEMAELQDAYRSIERQGAPDWHLVMNAIWRYLLLVELALAYKDHFKSKAERPLELDQVLDLLNFIPHKGEFVEAVLAVTTFARDANEHDLREFMRLLSANKVYQPFQALARKTSARLVIDNLDAMWDATHEGGRYVLASLIREAERLNQHLAPRVSVILFMRTVIYDAVKLVDPDIDKQSRERIRWDRDSLVEVIGSRLKYLLDLGKVPTGEAWYSAFPDTIEGIASIEFFVALTMRRPRELIKLCASAIELAQARRATRVSETDVLNAWSVYSDDMLTDLHGEYLVELPDLYYFCLELADKTWPATLDDVRKWVRGAARAEKDRGRSHTWLQEAQKHPDATIRRLYDIGILGLAGSREVFFAYDRAWLSAFARSRQAVERRYKRKATKTEWVEPRITLHPGLMPVLAGRDSSASGGYRVWERDPQD
jgi:Cdc6-like AAA superfamily ATPase